jgi:hypothetical protein
LDHIRDPDAIVRDHVFRNRSNFGYLPKSILRCALVSSAANADGRAYAG